MIVVGIDPGLKTTGYGFLKIDKYQSQLLETGTIRTKQTDSMEKRLETVYRNLKELLEEYHPDVLVLEKLYAHHTYVTTASILGHVRGVIVLLTAQLGLELAEHSVKRIRKALIGNGNASKVQIRSAIANQFRIDAAKLPLDASDAIALALGFQHLNQRRL